MMCEAINFQKERLILGHGSQSPKAGGTIAVDLWQGCHIMVGACDIAKLWYHKPGGKEE